MSDKIVRIKACKGDITAEIEIPWSLIIKDLGEWNQIENVLTSLYKAIDSNAKREHDDENYANTSSSQLESELAHGQPLEPIKLAVVGQDEPTENEQPLSEVIKNDSGWREIERLLIIIYYASDFGKADINRDDIISLYKEIGRANMSRQRNLSNNLQTLQKYKWIMVSRSGYYMTDEGIFRARGILARGKTSVRNQN
ncbi:MAG: hypothetical protein GTN76_05785 [Candidatus Aenigmarchaeota archaeon]|nr:hypothetical protein [Candidatus Aenigmarchaeota archaeon]